MAMPVNVFLILVMLACVLGLVFVLYREYYVKRKYTRLAKLKLKAFEPLMRKLNTGGIIHDEEILLLAQDASTRHLTFRALKAFGKEALFPGDYYSYEKAAESFLVNWLEFPTELGTTPDEIELVADVAVEENGKECRYYVFRFRMRSPHRPMLYTWMLGVVGPYVSGVQPFEIPHRIFSRFKEEGMVRAEEEVRWVHENVGK